MLISAIRSGYSRQPTEKKSLNKNFQFKVVQRVTILMGAGALVWTIGMISVGAYDLLFVPVAYLFISALSMYFCRFVQTSHLGCNVQMFVNILFPCLFQIIAGGLMASGAVMVWSVVALYSISTYKSSDTLMRWSICAIIIFGLTLSFEFFPVFQYESIINFSTFELLVFNMMSTYSILFYIAYFFMQRIEKSKSNLRTAVLEVKELNSELQERNDDHSEGMKHARDIQMAFLKSEDHLRTVFTKLFLLRGAKEYVSGDFIWAEQIGDFKYIICGDCSTKGSSHGLLTMLMVSTIERILQETEFTDPGIFLARIIESLHDYNNLNLNGISLDMKLTILLVNARTNKTKLATAGGSVLVKHKNSGELKQYQVESNGMNCDIKESKYASIDIDLAIGDMVYIYTDGFVKQENEHGEQIGENRFQKFIGNLDTEYSFIQKRNLVKELSQWQGSTEQNDDVLVCGFEIEDPSLFYEKEDELKIYAHAR